MLKLRLNYLHCAQAQEASYIGGYGVTDDEVRLTINELVVLFSGSMTSTQTTTEFQIPELEFSGTPQLKLIEEDMPEIGNEHDLLGTWTIEEQTGEFVATFTLNDAIYLLGYTVEWAGTPTDDSRRCGAPPGETLAYITPGTTVPESQRYDEYRALIESVGVFLGDGYNLLGLRGFQQPDRTVVENAWNDWNDTIAVIWRDATGAKRVKEYKATCDPGKHSKTAKSDGADANPDGLAHLCDGQWQYKTGYHGGDYPALVQAADFTVWRSKFRDDGWADNTYEDDETTDTGVFGINMHASKAGQAHVWNWSAGCQVFCSAKGAGTDYAEVMGPGTTSTAEHGGYVGEHFKTHDVIYYTLLTAREKGTEDENEECPPPEGEAEVGAAAVACPSGGGG